MDWMHKMNAAVRYIEENLEEDIDLAHIARLADCSVYHFQRVFSYMANVTLMEYIRRRRLTAAAFALQSGRERVLDVALRYGYDSPTSFARAFQALHGVSPREAREEGRTVTAYPPISFRISIQGAAAMNYRIESKESFRVVGVKLTTDMKNDEGQRAIPPFWNECNQNGTTARIAALIDREPFGILGVSVCDWLDKTEFDYYIAAATTKATPAGLEEYTVPACQWAVFECVGPMPHTIQALQKRIVTEWLPTSGYDYGRGPDIEVYGEGDTTAPDYRCEVWMPIQKK